MVDVCILVLGIRGVGKSDYALRRGVELGKSPMYILAHDPGYKIPEAWHDDKGKAHKALNYSELLQNGGCIRRKL